MVVGNIFSIEEFSVYDGPGIRTSVFLKGCPLRCSWCHNPEGQRYETEIVRSPNGCLSCGRCEETSIIKDGRKILTEKSIAGCPRSLIRICGEKYSHKALCEKLLKNERILKNDGGITFSGGEPFSQYEFMFECLKILKGRLHTAIQTCGYCREEVFEEALGLADYFLYDLKLIDDDLHKKYTGVSNKTIIRNFIRLAESQKPCTIRTPLIPGVTDTEQNLLETAEILKDNNIDCIELLPYNKAAGGKYRMVMREYKPDFDEASKCRPRVEIFESMGIKVKIM